MKQLKYILIQLTILFSYCVNAQSNIDCSNASNFIVGDCIAGEMMINLSATQGECADSLVQSLWYVFTANNSGVVFLMTDAEFNDAISIYTGSCTNTNLVNCYNNDEYGFKGEEVYFEVSNGTTYYIKLSNVKDEFGLRNGGFCIGLNWAESIPDTPGNDFCENAVSVVVNPDGINISNIYSTSGALLPKEELRSRSDVWFTFIATNNEMNLDLKGDFSNVITVYGGSCDDPVELYSSGSGSLFLDSLVVGESYLIQVAGNFSTIEGKATLVLGTSMSVPNTDCFTNSMITLNSPCIPFSNEQITFSGIRPDCEFGPEADIWYSFIAPPSNGVKIRTEANFLHSIALYEGECDSLNSVYCQSNPQSCEGYVTIENLQSGKKYYLQIMSKSTSFGYYSGSGCLELLDMNQGGNFIPLSLDVTPFCLSIDEASLELDVKGGEGNVVVQGNQHGDILDNGSSYVVKVTDDKGCVQLNKGTVSCDTKGECEVFYFLSTNRTSCNGDSDGSAYITSSNEGVTYDWSNGNTSNESTGMSSGSYSVTLTNSEGCTFDVLFIIEEPSGLTTQNTVVNASSQTASDGMISLVPDGGVPPYSFQWQSGDNQANLNNLSAGNYAYTISDNNGCTTADVVVVSVEAACPENQSLDLSITQNVQNCFAAQDWINSSSEIFQQADITYKAGNKITLTDGFRAKEGAKFRGFIESCATDMDQDGFIDSEDCDDDNALINPGMDETVYNGIDDDCDPNTLDDDLDQDGFVLADDCDDNNPAVNISQSEIVYNGVDDDCNPDTLDDDLDQDGFVLADDCDDNNANVNTGQSEITYNGIDDDCNSSTLDNDLDQDGFVLADDCDDNNANVNTGQTEITYNGIDDDCNPATLDDDLDQDGYVLADDCNDNDASIHPNGVEEAYNGIDDDCNPATLDDDLDQDGFVLADDCDDANASIHPNSVEEIYNGLDDDCNPETLDDDLDQDGYVLADDCNDNDSTINSGAEDIPNNGIDENCDGVDLVTSIHEIGNSTINIFPNPASDIVNVIVDGLVNYKVEVYSLNGTLVSSLVNVTSFDVEPLAPGIYLFVIVDNDTGQKVFEKVAVQ